VYCPCCVNSDNAKKQKVISVRVLDKVRNRLSKRNAATNPANISSDTTYNKMFDSQA